MAEQLQPIQSTLLLKVSAPARATSAYGEAGTTD
jgi:hypothetical protein